VITSINEELINLAIVSFIATETFSLVKVIWPSPRENFLKIPRKTKLSSEIAREHKIEINLA
jgi:hypothetical protein